VERCKMLSVDSIEQVHVDLTLDLQNTGDQATEM
jgi:hypothetical protein